MVEIELTNAEAARLIDALFGEVEALEGKVATLTDMLALRDSRIERLEKGPKWDVDTEVGGSEALDCLWKSLTLCHLLGCGPTEEEFDGLRRDFGLPTLTVEDCGGERR